MPASAAVRFTNSVEVTLMHYDIETHETRLIFVIKSGLLQNSTERAL